jgi:cell division cycle protein 20 (cofactor of APC complex)
MSSALELLSLSTSKSAAHTPSSTTTSNTSSPGHTARLAQATGVPLNKRILSYHEPPPTSTSNPTLSLAREFARPLLQRPTALPSSTGAQTNKSRKIPTLPERVLDAPGMVDDFYLNLVSWSSQNVVAVALAESTYIWRAETGNVSVVGEVPEGTYVSSVDFSNDGAYLGVGVGNGDVELWDVETCQKLRTMAGHQAQIAALSWHQHILSSACGDGSIWHHDVRVPRHKVMELLGHTGEVCGLRWREDGELLASGGNDNVVNVWDGRVGDVGGEAGRGSAKWTKRNHTAAVKVRFITTITTNTNVFNNYQGNCMVSLATLPPRIRRRHLRRNPPHLEHDHRRTATHPPHPLPNNNPPLLPPPQRNPLHARVPN